MSFEQANKTRNKKFSKSFVPGTMVTLTGNPDKSYPVKEVSDGRMYIKIDGFTGIFLRTHIMSYSNKPVQS